MQLTASLSCPGALRGGPLLRRRAPAAAAARAPARCAAAAAAADDAPADEPPQGKVPAAARTLRPGAATRGSARPLTRRFAGLPLFVFSHGGSQCRLIILRHADAVPRGDPAVDKARRLTSRGRRQAAAVARRVRRGAAPQL